MRLTTKLLGYLNRVFSTDPAPFLALRLRYDGNMQWGIEDGVLTTTVTGGTGVALEVDLSIYTLAQLSAHLGAQAGYSIAYSASGEQVNLSALALVDGKGDQDTQNGDYLLAHEPLLWAYLNALAVALKEAGQAIADMPAQLSLKTSTDDNLDALGDQYGIRRMLAETDAIYRARILAEIILPKNNNIAIEEAIRAATGGFPAQVVDAEAQDGGVVQRAATLRRGAFYRRGQPYYYYGLFDVTAGVDLVGGENLDGVLTRIRATIEKSRAAGMHLRAIALSGKLADTAKIATDSVQFSVSQSMVADEAKPVRGSNKIRNGTTQYAPQGDSINLHANVNQADAATADCIRSAALYRSTQRRGQARIPVDGLQLTLTHRVAVSSSSPLARNAGYLRGARVRGGINTTTSYVWQAQAPEYLSNQLIPPPLVLAVAPPSAYLPSPETAHLVLTRSSNLTRSTQWQRGYGYL